MNNEEGMPVFRATPEGDAALENLKGTELSVMTELLPSGVYATLEGLSDKIDKSAETVARAVNSLIKKGYLEMVPYSEKLYRELRGVVKSREKV